MTLKSVSVNVLIVSIFALMPIGVVLGFYYDEERWFLLAAAALIFFMAG